MLVTDASALLSSQIWAWIVLEKWYRLWMQAAARSALPRIHLESSRLPSPPRRNRNILTAYYRLTTGAGQAASIARATELRTSPSSYRAAWRMTATHGFMVYPIPETSAPVNTFVPVSAVRRRQGGAVSHSCFVSVK